MKQIEERSRNYRLKMIRTRAKNGLLLLTFRNALTRIGLDFEPYWLELEGLKFCSEPELKDNKEHYALKRIDDSVVREQYQLLSWNTKEIEEILSSDHYSYGLFRKDQLTSFMIARFNQYTFKNRKILLEPQEVYLENMYTYELFRGKNLAPYLRYKCYEELAKEGKTTCYSITQYFNRSSLKFKAKLGAKHLEMYLYIGLLGKYHKTILLRRYKAAGI